MADLRTILNQEIDKKASSGDESRSDIIQKLASSAGIEPSTVNEILNGTIAMPPEARLRGFASALGISLSRLQNADDQKSDVQECIKRVAESIKSALISESARSTIISTIERTTKAYGADGFGASYLGSM